MKLVLVEWIDPSSDGGWHNIDEVLQTIAERSDVCRTVGWVAFECEDYIVTVSSLGGVMNGVQQVGEAFKLPRRCINKITTLGAKKSEGDASDLEGERPGLGSVQGMGS